ERAAHWVAADGLLKRWEYGAKLARNTLTDANAAEKVVVDPFALLPTPLPPTNRELLRSVAQQSFQIDITAGDEAAMCTALRVQPDAAVTTLATDAVLLQGAIGLLLAHPQFHHR
ncbi:MAG: hypothetical protein ACYC2O_14135, partial [Microthrixaceae bacterium]